MKKIVLLLFVILLAAAAAGVWIYLRVAEPYRGYDAAEQFVEIPA